MSNQERPPVDENTKRLLRQEALFGCVICGFPLIEYAHILGWQISTKVEDIAVLCDAHHKKLDRREISKELVYEAKANPWNKANPGKKDQFLFSGPVNVIVGDTLFRGCQRLLTVDNEPIIYFENQDGITKLSAKFFNKEGSLILIIDKNEWLPVVDDIWDFTYEGGAITIRNKAYDIALDMRVWKNRTLVLQRGKMYYKGLAIEYKDCRFSLEDGTTLQMQRSVIDGGGILVDTTYGIGLGF